MSNLVMNLQVFNSGDFFFINKRIEIKQISINSSKKSKYLKNDIILIQIFGENFKYLIVF